MTLFELSSGRAFINVAKVLLCDLMSERQVFILRLRLSLLWGVVSSSNFTIYIDSLLFFVLFRVLIRA